MSKPEEKRYFHFKGTVFAYENVSHTLNVESGVVEVFFIYNNSTIILKAEIASTFIDEYKIYLDNIQRLHL